MEKIRIRDVRLKLQDCQYNEDDLSINFSLGNQLINLCSYMKIQYNRICFQEQMQFLINQKQQQQKLQFTILTNQTTNPQVIAKTEIELQFLKHYMKKKSQMKQSLVKNYLIVGWIYFQCFFQTHEKEIPIQLLFIKELNINYKKKPWINYKLRVTVDRKKIFRQRVRGNIFDKQIPVGIATIVKNSTALQIFLIDQDQIKPLETQSSNKISSLEDDVIPKNWNFIQNFQKEKLSTLTFLIKQAGRELGTCSMKYIVTEIFLPLQNLTIYKTGFLNIREILKVDKCDCKSGRKISTIKYSPQTIINRVKKVIIQEKQNGSEQLEHKSLLKIQPKNFLQKLDNRTSLEKKSKTIMNIITLKTENTPGRQDRFKNNSLYMSFQDIENMLQQ